tara:strand:- start:3306 stop:4094 length:789 start_codon:yes stop_codon:yes gene_type:complete
MRKRTIKSWVDALPPEAVAIRIRLGTGRNQPTLSIVAIEGSGFVSDDAGIIYCKEPELASLIEELALDAGWKEEEPTIRLHAISDKGKPLASWQLTERNKGSTSNEKGSAYAISALTDGVLSMAAQLTKTIDILTESLAHSESSRAHMFEAMLEAREDQLGAESAALLAAMDNEPEAPDPIKQQAVDALSSVASVLVGGGAMGEPVEFTAEDVRRKAEQDIWFKADLAKEYANMNKSPGAPDTTQKPESENLNPEAKNPDVV